MATGTNLKPTKAIYAAVIGFLAPGATYLIGVNGDGVQSNEWVNALLFCVAGAAVLGGGTYGIENKPKAP